MIARYEALLPWLKQELTVERINRWFAHVQRGKAVRYELPGLLALNFVLINALDGGGTSSLFLDPQGKSYAQQLLAMPVKIPASLLEHARRGGEQ